MPLMMLIAGSGIGAKTLQAVRLARGAERQQKHC